MKGFIKESVMGLLVWACIIWFCAFDPEQMGKWFKIALCLGSATWFWWWIFDFDNPFVADSKNEKV